MLCGSLTPGAGDRALAMLGGGTDGEVAARLGAGVVEVSLLDGRGGTVTGLGVCDERHGDRSMPVCREAGKGTELRGR